MRLPRDIAPVAAFYISPTLLIITINSFGWNHKLFEQAIECLLAIPSFPEFFSRRKQFFGNCILLYSVKYAKHTIFFDDSTISYQKMISGDRVTQITVASFHCLITKTTNPCANTRRLCNEWNKYDAILYIWSYFLITFRRIDSFCYFASWTLPHLFHWPRLLYPNVHQFVRILWFIFFFPPSIYPNRFFSPVSTWMCNYVITVSAGFFIVRLL